MDSLEAGLWFPLGDLQIARRVEYRPGPDALERVEYPFEDLTLFGLENYSAFPGTRELTALIQIIERTLEAGRYHLKANNRVKLVEKIPS